MSSSNSYSDYFTSIYINAALRGNAHVDMALQTLRKAEVRYVSDKSEIPRDRMSSHTLFVDQPRSSIVSACPGSCGHVCCNYLTINLYAGCIIGCSYCIMKHYLNFSPIVVNVASERTIDEVFSIAKSNPGKVIRIGTGEVGDSLDLDPIFNLSAPLIRAFSGNPDIVFELKTKTDSIGHILNLEHKGNAVIGFSVNPERITRQEDGSASTLDERLAAAGRAAAGGYRVAFHFDPVFLYPGWENDYSNVIDRLTVIPENRIAWISMGTFRYPKGLKEKIEDRWFLYDEFVPCRDGKFRYIQKIRAGIYAYLAKSIRVHYPRVPVYLCMESACMWTGVFGSNPHTIPELHDIFDRVDLK